MIRFDADRHLPFPIDELELAYRVLAQSDGRNSRVVLTAARREDLDPCLDMLRNAGVDPDFITVSVIGTSQVFSAAVDGGNVAVLDFGFRRTDLAIYHGRSLIFSRALQTGVERLQELGAGRYPNFHTDPESGTRPESQWLKELLPDLQRSLQSFRYESDGGRVERLLLCGGLAHASGIEDALEKTLKIHTLAAEDVLPDQIDPGKIGPLVPEMTCALGAALQVALHGEPEINLLPRHVVEERARRQQKSFISQVATLSIMIILLLAGIILNRHHRLSQYVDARKTQSEELAQLLEDVQNKKTKLDSIAQLQDDACSAYRILESIYRITPDRIELERFHFLKQNTVELRGRAFSDREDVYPFGGDLLESPLFVHMELGASTSIRVHGIPLRRFTMDVFLATNPDAPK
jgi:Tfp pilus assembly protein PilN